jgi:hypothetical protein
MHPMHDYFGMIFICKVNLYITYMHFYVGEFFYSYYFKKQVLQAFSTGAAYTFVFGSPSGKGLEVADVLLCHHGQLGPPL